MGHAMDRKLSGSHCGDNKMSLHLPEMKLEYCEASHLPTDSLFITLGKV
jgi:hypothetical protein